MASRRGIPARVAAAAAAVAIVLPACTAVEALTEPPRLDPATLDVDLPETSKIYAADGTLITSFHGEQNRTAIRLKRIPERIRRAVIAIEDERFYEHGGVDLQAIARAALTNFRSGGIEQGGSTITQQYVKKTIIAPEKPSAQQSLERKVEEAALARQLEKILTKDEILERYLNTVYFGNGAYGVQAAARTYFERGVRNLTLRQAALIAGLVKSPSQFDPYTYPERAKRRRNVVMSKMAELGWTTRAHADRAASKGLGLAGKPKKRTYRAAYFIDYVQRLLTHHPRFDVLGDTVEERTRRLFNGGLRIQTTVDLGMQRKAERAVRSVLTERGDPHGAVAAVDPRTGEVKAMVGGRDFFARGPRHRYSKLNLAIAAQPGLGVSGGGRKAPGTGRQAGSAFKTFALAAAIERGVPLSKVFKAPACMTFPRRDNGDDWDVCNYGRSSYGSLPLLEATIRSVNVVFAQLILEVGSGRVVDVARRAGLRTDLQAVPSATLGTNPVNALGMASGYATLAAGGVHRPPVAVTKIVDRKKGKVIYEAPARERRVLDPSVAALVTRALRRTVTSGTGIGAQIGRPAAGKTGTAQEYRDAWFAGYTPQLATAVWVGYPRASISMRDVCATADRSKCRPTRITVTGGSWPAAIWKAFMTDALTGKPVLEFRTPGARFERATIDVRTGCLAGKRTPKRFRDEARFPAGKAPEERCAPPGRGSEEAPD